MRRAWLSAATLVAVVAAASMLPPSAAGSAGELDPSFGTGGSATFALKFERWPQDVSPETVAAVGAGKTEVVGWASCGCGEWLPFAARLLENGSLDPSFGAGGTLITSTNPEDQWQWVQLPHAGVVEPDGAIAAVGNRMQIRFTSSGQLDPAFNKANTPLNSYALLLLANGDLLAAGEAPTEGQPRYPALERILPDGQPDTSFGPEGVVRLPDHPGENVIEGVQSALLLPNGEFLLAGVGATNSPSVGQQGFGWLAKVAANGTLDPSFGTGGTDYLPVEYSYHRDISVAREPNGEIIVAGGQSIGPEKSQATVWAFSPDGVPNTAFGAGGEARLPLTEHAEEATPKAVTTDAQGDIYVAVNESERHKLPGSYVARLAPSGALDQTFGHGGIAVTPGPTTIQSLTLDSTGRLVAAGGQAVNEPGAERSNLFLERLLGATAVPAISAPPLLVPTAPPSKKPSVAIRRHLTCTLAGIRRHGHRRIRLERCVLSLARVRGRWSSLEVTLARAGHVLVRRRSARVRLPATFRFQVTMDPRPVRCTVTLRRGHRIQRATWTSLAPVSR